MSIPQNPDIQALILEMLRSANQELKLVSGEVQRQTVAIAELKVEMRTIEALRTEVDELERQIAQIRRHIDSVSYVEKLVAGAPAILIALASFIWTLLHNKQ